MDDNEILFSYCELRYFNCSLPQGFRVLKNGRIEHTLGFIDDEKCLYTFPEDEREMSEKKRNNIKKKEQQVVERLTSLFSYFAPIIDSFPHTISNDEVCDGYLMELNLNGKKIKGCNMLSIPSFTNKRFKRIIYMRELVRQINEIIKPFYEIDIDYFM